MFWQIFDLAFLLLIFYIPFGLAFNIAPDIDLASVRVLIAALFLVWLGGGIFQNLKILKFQYKIQSLGLLAILVFGGLSLFGAPEAGWGLRKLLVFLSIFPLYFMAASFLKNDRRREKLLKIMFASAAFSAVLGLVQFLSQFAFGPQAILNLYLKNIGPVFWGQNLAQMVEQNPSWLVNISGSTIMRAFGLFPDPHMLAFFLGLVLPIAVSLFISNLPPLLRRGGAGGGDELGLQHHLFESEYSSESERPTSILPSTKGRRNSAFRYSWLFVICILMSLVLLLTFSRGGYLGLFFSVMAVLALAWRPLGKKQKRVILSAAVLGLFLIMVFAGPVASRFISSFLLNEGSSLGRLEIWKSSWQVFLGNPLLGVGLGNYPRAIEPLAVYRTPITSHNLYLDILSETGIFGFAVWMFLIFGSAWQLLREIKGDWGNLGALRIGVFGSLVYFSVHSFFETAIFNPAILAILMIIFALTSVANKNLTHPTPLFKKERELSQ